MTGAILRIKGCLVPRGVSLGGGGEGVCRVLLTRELGKREPQLCDRQ